MNMNSIFKNVFTLLCLAITVLLIYQLLLDFVVEKPTTAAKLKKQLELDDLPVVMICMRMPHGFNNATLMNHGYHISTYWRGALQPGFDSQFIGWNGRFNNNKSSYDILEEALLLPKTEALIANEGGYTENHTFFDRPEVRFVPAVTAGGSVKFLSVV